METQCKKNIFITVFVSMETHALIELRAAFRETINKTATEKRIFISSSENACLTTSCAVATTHNAARASTLAQTAAIISAAKRLPTHASVDGAKWCPAPTTEPRTATTLSTFVTARRSAASRR